MSKFVKEMILKEMEGRLDGNRDLLVVDSSRMDAITNNSFRLKLAAKGIHQMTVKNSLALRVLGIEGEQAKGIFSGSSTLVWGGEDIVALSKEVTSHVEEIEELDLKGGSAEGQTLDVAAVEKLSKSPGRRELISIIAGQILSPGAQLAGALLGPAGTLAGCVKSIADKDEE